MAFRLNWGLTRVPFFVKIEDPEVAGPSLGGIMARDDMEDGGWEDAEVPEEDAVLWRLAELGIPADVPRRAIREGQIAGEFCTAAHPVFYGGSRVYGETNGSLRLQLAMLKWFFNDDSCIPRVISPDGNVVVTALCGDAQTGLRHGRDAQTRRPRRTASLRIIRRNSQLVMSEMFPVNDAETLPETAEIGPTWFLLYHRDGDKVRSELSLAMGVAKSGGLLKWSERLILPEIDMLDGPPGPGHDRADDGEPDVDVLVVPRAG